MPTSFCIGSALARWLSMCTNSSGSCKPVIPVEENACGSKNKGAAFFPITVVDNAIVVLQCVEI